MLQGSFLGKDSNLTALGVFRPKTTNVISLLLVKKHLAFRELEEKKINEVLVKKYKMLTLITHRTTNVHSCIDRDFMISKLQKVCERVKENISDCIARSI